MGQRHLFDTEIAVKYGVNAAILLENFGYWVGVNRANRQNFYDGYYWTYNSVKAYGEIFPYMSKRQIQTAIEKLVDEGLVIKGNYNKSGFDRTAWYTLSEKGENLLNGENLESTEMLNGLAQNVEWIDSKCEMDCPEMSNPFTQNVEPIPNINTYINTDVNTNNKKTKKKASGFDSIVDSYSDNDELKNTIREFIKFRKGIKAQLTDHALELILKKLDNLADNDDDKIELLNQSIEHGWRGIFELKGKDKKQSNSNSDASGFTFFDPYSGESKPFPDWARDDDYED